MASVNWWMVFVIGWGILGFLGFVVGEFIKRSFEIADLMAIPGAILLGPLIFISLFIE